MSDILDRLKGNGEPWTFTEVIDEIEELRKREQLIQPAEKALIIIAVLLLGICASNLINTLYAFGWLR